MHARPHEFDRAQPSRSLLGVLLAAAGMKALAACNTTEGAGEDLEHLGESIQEAAD